MISGFWLALSFLSRIPLPKRLAERQNWETPLAQAAWAFPIVGIILGALAAGVYILAITLGISATIASWVAVSFYLLLTGGLHEDGLADMADGLAHGRTQDEKLAIMKDSRIGSYGVIALIIILCLRANALAIFSASYETLLVIAGAAALSRAGMVFSMYYFPSARTEGLAAQAGKPTRNHMLLAVAIGSVPLAILLQPQYTILCFCVAALSSLFVGRLAVKHFGGITGDVLGATQQITEVILLVILGSSLLI